MKMIFKIAKTELRNLFYSPVAWFLTIAFTVQCAYFYTSMLENIARWQDIMVKNKPDFKGFERSFTQTLFLSTDGIFDNALQNLYLFVPLLTMGLIGREISNGTIKLLYSSPVKTRQIVIGKYLAIMLYNVLLVLIVGIFMICGLFNVQHIDYGILLSAALGFYLLVCAYTAIGIFMSALTTYQIVAAIGSFITIFVLSRIGGLWQQYDLVRDLTYFLSLQGRTIKMLKGLITTKDVIYFVLIVFMFMSFTLIKMKGSRESRPWYLKAGKYLGVIVIVLLAGYISGRPGMIGYWDATRDDNNTLHRNTQAVVKELGDEPLEVTLYTNLLGTGNGRGMPVSRNEYLTSLWEPYLRFKPNITFNYVYYYDMADDDSSAYKAFPGRTLDYIAGEAAKGMEIDINMFLKPAEIRKLINMKDEAYRVVMQVKYKGKTTFLRTFDDALFWPDEMQVSAALKRLILPEMPKVAYVTGNLERNVYKRGEREFMGHSTWKGNRVSLVNLGFDPDSINLDTQEIPAHLSSLVLADPKKELSETAKSKISRYLSEGGNMIFFGEPGKQYVLNPILKQVGVQLTEGTLIELSKDEVPNYIVPYMTMWAAKMAPEPGMIRLLRTKGRDTFHQPAPGWAPVDVSDSTLFTMNPLLVTVPGRAWVKAGKLVVDSTAPDFNPAEGDFQQPVFNMGVALHRTINNKEQRIVVIGDADFMSNLRGGGDALARASFRWMDYDRFPIYAARPYPIDDKLIIGHPAAKAIKMTFIWILPALILMAGIILLIRRKRQ